MKRGNIKYGYFASLLNRKIGRRDSFVFKSEQDKKEFAKISFLWNECQPRDMDTSGVWQKTLNKISQADVAGNVHPRSRRATRLRSIVGYSAAAALVTFALLFAYLYSNNHKSSLGELEQMLSMKDFRSIKEVTLFVTKGKPIELKNNSKINYSPNGKVKAGSILIDNGNEEYNRIVVPVGKRSEIVLSDNTRIWINSESELVYPRLFKGNHREIYVSGELYLEVAHDTRRPFTVKTTNFEVEVVGTSFNISAYRTKGEASVVLVNGSVKVRHKTIGSMQLLPNEKVDISESGIIGKERVNALDYTSWINSIWIIKGETLKEVLQKLSTYYGQNISCLPEIENETLHGKLYLNNDVDAVIQAIMNILPGKYSKREDAITLKQ